MWLVSHMLLFLMNPHLRDCGLPAPALSRPAAERVPRHAGTAGRHLPSSTCGARRQHLLLATYGRALVAYAVAYSFLYGFTEVGPRRASG